MCVWGGGYDHNVFCRIRDSIEYMKINWSKSIKLHDRLNVNTFMFDLT